MSILLSLALGLFFCWFSKKLFYKWLNPLLIYSLSWTIFIVLYELKLMRFIPIQTEAWVIILSSFLSFFLGTITLLSVKNYSYYSNHPAGKTKIEFNEDKLILFIYLFATIGLVVALQHWMVLINKFGSISAVFLRANLIYKMRVEGEITGTIPYLNAFSYAAVFLGGIYTAIKGKITVKAVFPLVVIILQDMASVGRAGIFMAFILFIISYFFLRHFFTKNEIVVKLNKINIAFAIFIVLGLFFLSTTVIKNVRGTVEKFKASTPTLNELERSYFISPSLYLYFSSNIGVLSKYLEKSEGTKLFGENTFLPLYHLISKINIVEHSGFYPKGYYVPMWSNSATYLRDIHEDFGYPGIFIIPFILGLLTTYLWYRFFDTGSLISLILLVYITLVVAFSTFYMVTRAAVFLLSLIILIFTSSSLVQKKYNLHN